MAEHACNYKEWGLQCTFHSKDIGDQCDQISQHVNERFVTRYDMKWDGTVDVYMQSEKLRWKSEVVCVVVVFGVTKKKREKEKLLTDGLLKQWLPLFYTKDIC